MSTQLPNATFTIDNVMTVESSFKREYDIDFESGSIHTEIALNNGAQVDPDTERFSITMEAEIKGLQEENIVFEAKVVIVGVFSKKGEGDLDLDTFTKINGPAILFPFLREHIAGLSIKAGIGTILLQPVNFTKAK